MEFETLFLHSLGSQMYLQFPFKGMEEKNAGNAEPEYSHLNEAVVAEKVLAARVRVFADRSLEGSKAAPLGMVLMAWVNWESAGWMPVSVWFLLLLGVQALNAWMSLDYLRSGSSKPNVLEQARNLTLTNFLAGLGWGLGILIFWVDGELNIHMLNLAILMGVAGFAMLLESVFVGSMVLFFGGLLIPPAIHGFLMGYSLGL